MEPVKVKILGLSCAHRKGRNTAWMVQYCLKVIEKFGRKVESVAQIETEFIDLADKKIKPCWDCQLCYEMPYRTKKPQDFSCVIKDDYLATELQPIMASADGYIFGAPVYTGVYPSKFRILFERLAGWQWTGCFTNKPAAGCTAGLATIGGGQDTCLNAMNNCVSAVEMMPVAWMHGAGSSVGPPLGPFPSEDDGRVIAVKGDRVVQYVALVQARRVADIALMQKLARQELGDVYSQEFIQVYSPPHGQASWEWTELEPEDEEHFARQLSGMPLGGRKWKKSR